MTNSPGAVSTEHVISAHRGGHASDNSYLKTEGTEVNVFTQEN